MIPHPVWIHWITKTDMAGGTFAETELAEETEGAGHVFEAPGTLGEGGCEGRLQGHVDCACAVADGEGVHWAGGGDCVGAMRGFGSMRRI